MNTTKRNTSGFTMVELLVVLVIIGILAAVATPIFLGNTQKAKASEAVATMSLIRQAQRDYFINNNSYITSISDISKTAPNGLNIDTGVTQYFGNDAYTVVAPSAAAAPWNDSDLTDGIPAQDFIVKVTGDDTNNNNCGDSQTPVNCGLKTDEVKDFRLEMDNSGRVFVSYNGSDWQKY